MNNKNKYLITLLSATLLVTTGSAQEIAKFSSNNPSQITEGQNTEFEVLFDKEAAKQENAWGSTAVEKITLKTNNREQVIAQQDGGLTVRGTQGDYNIYRESNNLNNLNLQPGNNYNIKAEIEFVAQGFGASKTYETGQKTLSINEKQENNNQENNNQENNNQENNNQEEQDENQQKESQENGEIPVYSLEHPQATTGKLPITIRTETPKVNQINFQFQDRKIKQENFERNNPEIKTSLNREELSYGFNTFNISLKGRNTESETLKTQAFLQENPPELKFKEFTLNKLIYPQNTTEASLTIENPSQTLYADNISIKLTAENKSQKIKLKPLKPKKERTVNFEIANEITNQETITLNYKKRKITEITQNNDDKITAKQETKNKVNTTKLKKLIEQIRQTENYQTNETLKTKVSMLEAKLNYAEELETNPERIKRIKRIEENLTQIKNTTTDTKSNSTTGNAFQAPSIESGLWKSVSALAILIFGFALLHRKKAIHEEKEETEKVQDQEDEEDDDQETVWGLP